MAHLGEVQQRREIFTSNIHQRTLLSAGVNLHTVFSPHPGQLCPNSCSVSVAEIQIFTVTSAL